MSGDVQREGRDGMNGSSNGNGNGNGVMMLAVQKMENNNHKSNQVDFY